MPLCVMDGTRKDATVNAGAGKSTLSNARRAKAGGVAADLDNAKSITAPLYRYSLLHNCGNVSVLFAFMKG